MQDTLREVIRQTDGTILILINLGADAPLVSGFTLPDDDCRKLIAELQSALDSK